MKIEWFWNIVYYFIFRFEIFTQKLISYPFVYLYNLPFIKNYYTNKNIDLNKRIEKTIYGRKNSVNSTLAGIQIGFLASSFVGTIFHVLLYIFSIPISIFYITPYAIITCIIFIFPPVKFNDIVLYNNDKYLKYFKEFDKYDKKWKIKWGILILLFYLITIFLSFYTMFIFW
jgi:hypothetical protein